jgi:hypothetical protein
MTRTAWREIKRTAGDEKDSMAVHGNDSRK